MDVIVLFDTIFQEDRMTKTFVSNVLENSQIMCSMYGNYPSVGMMDSITFNKGVHHRSIQVKVNRVSTNDHWLPNVGELSIGYSSDGSSLTVSVDHHMCSVQGFDGVFRITSDQDVSSK
jgi:hypothetical protein